ncbi:MAG: GAF domain-containing protein [Burkholderiales bacterium]|nr:GAF domain-containing protein [Anaerolineae bacterium]
MMTFGTNPIKRLGRSLLRLDYPYSDALERQHALTILLLNWLLVGVWLIWLVVFTIPDLLRGIPVDVVTGIVLVALPMVCYTIYQLVQGGKLSRAVALLTALMLLSTFSTIAYGISTPFVIMSVFPLIVAVMLLNRIGILLVTLILVATLVTAAMLQSPDVSIYAASDLGIVLITLVIVVAILALLRRNLELVLNNARGDVQRLSQLAAFNAQLGETYNENDIVNHANRLIVDQFAGVFSQIMLFDDKGMGSEVVRINEGGAAYQIYGSTGEQQSGNFGDQFVNENNAIGRAVRQRQLTTSTRDDAADRRSHLRSTTDYDVAIPLLHPQSKAVIGVLNVQSPQGGAFIDEQINLLQLLADQVSVTLSYVYRINELWHELSSDTRRIDYVPPSLRVASEAEIRRPQAGRVLDNYLSAKGSASHGFDIYANNPTPIAADDIPDGLLPALQAGKLHIESGNGEQVINVPIRFRGQTLGAMSFTVANEQPITDRQLELAQIVSDRLGLALENSRLFEQTQAQALRERKASEVANLLFSTTNVDTMLNLAAESFREALGAVSTRVFVQPGTLTPLASPLAEPSEHSEEVE